MQSMGSPAGTKTGAVVKPCSTSWWPTTPAAQHSTTQLTDLLHSTHTARCCFCNYARKPSLQQKQSCELSIQEPNTILPTHHATPHHTTHLTALLLLLLQVVCVNSSAAACLLPPLQELVTQSATYTTVK